MEIINQFIDNVKNYNLNDLYLGLAAIPLVIAGVLAGRGALEDLVYIKDKQIAELKQKYNESEERD